MSNKKQKKNIRERINPQLIKEYINFNNNKIIYYLCQHNNQYYKLNKDIIIKKSKLCNGCNNNIVEPCYIFYRNTSKLCDNISEYKYLCNNCYEIRKKRQEYFMYLQ